MKKLLLLMLVLGLVVSASAGLKIVVKSPDFPLWGEYADSKFTISPSDEIMIGVMDLNAEAQPGAVYALGISQGPASLDADAALTVVGVSAAMIDDAALAAELGLQNNFIALDIGATPPPSLLVRDVLFHCDGPGDVTLALIDYASGLILDTQVIHQIPEPMTLALLGLGGLALRATRKRS